MPCVFCRADGPLTAEHVFPVWMQKWLDDPGGGIHTRIEYNAKTAEIRDHARRSKPATVTVRSVCASCNNGWMSRMETSARPFIETMLRGNRREYHEGGRTALASWLVKTALIAGSKSTARVRQEMFSEFFENRQPSENTRVWLAATPERLMHTWDVRPLAVHLPDGPMPTVSNAYSAVISVGYFAGYVVSWFDLEPDMRRVGDFSDALVPIWPVANRPAHWPPRRRVGLHDLDAMAEGIHPAGLKLSRRAVRRL